MYVYATYVTYSYVYIPQLQGRCKGIQPAVQSEGIVPTTLPSPQTPTSNSGVPTTTLSLSNLLK